MGWSGGISLLFVVTLTITANLAGGASNAENLILPDEELRMNLAAAVDEGDSASSENQTKPTLSQRPIFVIVSFDGFRYDYFTKAETPNLNWIKDHGISASYMKPQFPTKTFPNHHSMSTGLHPESHGVVDNVLFDPLLNKRLGVKDEEFWVYGDNVVPMWVLNEWGGGVSGVMMWPGSLYGYGPNKTKATHVVDFDRNLPYESCVDTVMTWLTNATNPANLVFMYFAEPDEHAHAFGPESPEVNSYIERMDNVTGYFIRKLRDQQILDQVNLIFLSDHGFEEVTQNHIINISNLLKPERYAYFGGSPVYHIEPNPGEDLDKLFQDLKHASEGLNFSVYKKEEIEKEKPHWFYSSNRRISPIILVADLGYVFDDFYRKMANYDKGNNRTHLNTNVYGMHGYDNHLIHMHPFFRGRGPAFRSGMEIEPFENINLFPLLCHLLNIQTPPNNGTIVPMLKLLFREGFNVRGAPIGWIIGGGVVIALIILFVISTLLVKRKRRRNRYSTAEDSVGYHNVVNSERVDLVGLDDNRKGGLITVKGRTLEEIALLNSSHSEESLSSAERA